MARKNDESEIKKNEKNTAANAEAAENIKEADKKTEAPKTPTAEEQLTAERDRYLRLAAEYDNYRKRSQREFQALYNDVKADTVSQLLPVYDDLERAAAHQTSDEAYAKGVVMTLTKFTELLAKLGVQVIETVGKPFDPAFMDAMLHVDDETVQENTVVEELKKGFTLGDKVIRFAMVKVAN